VNPWQVSSNPRTGRYEHRFSGEHGHALLAPIVAFVFETLRVSASVWDGHLWWALRTEPNISRFEFEHGKETARYAHNEKSLKLVLREERSLVGEHAGFCDLFVPVRIRGEMTAVLVVGPFAAAAPTSTDVLSRWFELTGRQGHPTDPEFASYLEATLATLVLHGKQQKTFVELVECLAKLMGSEGKTDSVANRADALRVELEPARVVERTWATARSMLDQESAQSAQSFSMAYDLKNLGLSRSAEDVVVGLFANRADTADAVGDVIRRNAFQRSAVALSRDVGEVIAGRVGEHGVVFLSAAKGAPRQRRRRQRELVDRASELARRKFGLLVHFGASDVVQRAPLDLRYQAALAAAESALTSKSRLVIGEAFGSPRPGLLPQLRSALAENVELRPAELRARFERYMEVLGAECRYRLDAMRAQLDFGFERLTDPLLQRGTLETKSYLALREHLTRSAAAASTAAELFEAYRRAVADISDAVEHPAQARRGRSLRSALEYVDRHYAEDLSLKQVARVAGFTPTHFSLLFKQRERVSFSQYLIALRLERAQQLLLNTDLDLVRVAELTGFRTSQYLCRVFQRVLRVSPGGYRKRASQLRNQVKKSVIRN
jgi:AraC-like DNA-binding protein